MKVFFLRQNIGIKVIVVLMLSVATLLLSNMINRYEVAGGELLENNNFDKKFENWYKQGDAIAVLNETQPVVQLKSDGNQTTVAIRQKLENIQKGQPVRLVGTLKTHDVGRGDKAWKAARIIFVAIDDDGRSVFSVPHILVTRNGTTDWESFSKVFVAISHAAGYYVEIQLVNVPGVLWVKDLSLQPVKESFAFSLFWIVGVLSWFAVTLWILAPHWRTIFDSNVNILIMLIMIVALLGALVPADLKHSVMELMKFLFPVIDDETGFFRIGHFLVYGMLSVAVFWKAQSGRLVITRSGFLILFAMATEVLQFLVDGRTPRMSDFFVDASGMALGLFLSQIFSPYNKICSKQGVG